MPITLKKSGPLPAFEEILTDARRALSPAGLRAVREGRRATPSVPRGPAPSRNDPSSSKPLEHPFPVGALVPPHVHTREDEFSIVTEGEIGFRPGDKEVVLGAGGYITKPRNELHSMWNAGASPARMIEIISPAGFEGFFWELADLLTAGPPRQSQVGQVADKYGLLFQDAPWLADVVERHHLASGQAGVPA